MKAIDLSKILRPYEKKWVALNPKQTEVLASGKTPQEVLSLARRKSSEEPIITFVPRFDADYVG